MKKVDKSSSAGTNAEQSTNVDVNSVSQPIAKPNVACCLKSNDPMRKRKSMINRQDLRIGNVVYPNGENSTIYPIIEIKTDVVVCKMPEFEWQEVCAIDYSDLHGILLSKDILKKLKFRSHKSDYENFYWIFSKSYSDGYITVLCDSEVLQSFVVTLTSGGWMRHIKYVHQLQNLYYCLTGEELNMYDVMSDK